MRILRPTGLLSLGVLAVAPLAAQTLQNAQWSGSFLSTVSHQNNSVLENFGITGPGSVSNQTQSGIIGDTLSANFTGVNSFAPSLSASIVSTMPTPGPNYPVGHMVGANITASLDYSFMILGPTSTVLVDIDALGTAAISALGVQRFGVFPNTTEVRSSLDIISATGTRIARGATLIQSTNPNPGPSSYAPVVGSPSSGFTSQFVIDLNAVQLLTNTVYNVDLDVSAYSFTQYFYGGGDYSASAYVNPLLSISLANIDPNQYSIVYSPGLTAGNPNGVPDVGGTLVLMGISMGALLSLSRHRGPSGHRS